MSAANAAPYHAGPGTAHEIGIMVAFIAAFVLSMGAYYLVWRGAFCWLLTCGLGEELTGE